MDCKAKTNIERCAEMPQLDAVVVIDSNASTVSLEKRKKDVATPLYIKRI